MLKHIQPLKGKKILDVGCGHGYVFKFCRNAGASAIGMDINPKGLKVPHEGCFIVGDAESLPFRDNSFDNVTALNS